MPSGMFEADDMHTLEPMRAAIVMTGPTVRSRPPLPESTTVLCAYVTMARMHESVSILPMLLLAAKPLRMISPIPNMTTTIISGTT